MVRHQRKNAGEITMSWKDIIIKAPFDYEKRKKAKEDEADALRRLKETEPKEDVSTDVSRFASKYLDSDRHIQYGRTFVNKREGYDEKGKWKSFTDLIKKYGKEGLEKELGKLYNTKVFLTHRDVDTEYEDYVIDLQENRELRFQ